MKTMQLAGNRVPKLRDPHVHYSAEPDWFGGRSIATLFSSDGADGKLSTVSTCTQCPMLEVPEPDKISRTP